MMSWPSSSTQCINHEFQSSPPRIPSRPSLSPPLRSLPYPSNSVMTVQPHRSYHYTFTSTLTTCFNHSLTHSLRNHNPSSLHFLPVTPAHPSSTLRCVSPSATVQCLGVIQPLEIVVLRSEFLVMGVASTIACCVSDGCALTILLSVLDLDSSFVCVMVGDMLVDKVSLVPVKTS